MSQGETPEPIDQIPRERLEAVYAEAKRLVDSLDEIAVLRSGAWGGVDLQPLCDLLGGPPEANFDAALETIEAAHRKRNGQ